MAERLVNVGGTPFDQAADDAAKAVEGQVPEVPKPVVEAAAKEAAKVVDDAAAQAPAAEAAAAKADPGLNALAHDIAGVASGEALPLSSFVSDFKVGQKEVKTGYKTTEFWLTAGVIVFSQVAALSIPGKYGAAISEAAAAVSAGLYAIARGVAKH